MLQRMREAQAWMIKGVLWAVVLAFVVTIFYSWGVRSASGPTRSEVATIFGQPISAQTFQRTQNALYQSYQQVFRNQPGFDLREHFNFRDMALEQLAKDALLLRMAEQNGLVVTDQELADHIARIPAFQEAGRFDPRRYEMVLRSQVPPIAPQRFEAEQRESLLRNKIYTLVQQSAQVTELEAEQSYRREHEQVAVRYVTLIPSLFETQVTVTDEALQAYYEAHRETYRDAERRQIRYVAIAPQRFTVERDFSPAEIEAYYTAHQDTFQRPEQVHARHILFKLTESATAEQEAAVRARAEAVLGELREGADFAALAEKYSEDTATATAGGDLGFFPRGQMVNAFEDVAFSLPIGQLSDLVRTPFGLHILRVEEKTAAGLQALSEVQQDIVTRLREEKAREAAVAFTDDFVVTLEDNPTRFVELATQHDLPVVTTSFITATESVPEVIGVPDFVRRAFALQGQAVDTVQGAEGVHYVLQVAEIQPATIPALDALRDRVAQDVRMQQAAELASQKAEEWVKQVQAGTTLEELASSLQMQVSETTLFKRGDAIPQLGRVPAFSRVAFELQPNEVGMAREGSRVFVLQVTERREADMTAYAQEKAQYHKTLLDRKQGQMMQAFQHFLTTQYHTLRQQGDIVVNPQYF
jgi:peptidyl-prolyl cis-trans isomerase D